MKAFLFSLTSLFFVFRGLYLIYICKIKFKINDLWLCLDAFYPVDKLTYSYIYSLYGHVIVKANREIVGLNLAVDT